MKGPGQFEPDNAMRWYIFRYGLMTRPVKRSTLRFEVLTGIDISIFHDFQQETEKLQSHSYPIDDLLVDYSCNKSASKLVWSWLYDLDNTPKNTITEMCRKRNIPVLMFTGSFCDFWQMDTAKRAERR